MSRPCAEPRCPNLQPCATHIRKPFATAVRSSELYATARWKRERAAFLKRHPVCVHIQLQPEYAVGPIFCRQPATVVDHVVPHRGDERRFWDRSNWASLCRKHSNVKTGRETRERMAVR